MSDPGADEGALTAPFRILTVCTGNICRSPMSERLLQAGLDERFPGQFEVESAGTAALEGNPIDHRVAGFIQALGGTAEHFSARMLTPKVLQGHDLVLALTREHRSRIVELAPNMLRKTFTLQEFARLTNSLRLDSISEGADRWRQAIPKAIRARSISAGEAVNDDVVDPYGRSEEHYLQMRREIVASLSIILARW
jgi:protein-tyrosine phosphatase